MIKGDSSRYLAIVPGKMQPEYRGEIFGGIFTRGMWIFVVMKYRASRFEWEAALHQTGALFINYFLIPSENWGSAQSWRLQPRALNEKQAQLRNLTTQNGGSRCLRLEWKDSGSKRWIGDLSLGRYKARNRSRYLLLIPKLVFFGEIFSLPFLITPFYPSRGSWLWFFANRLGLGISLVKIWEYHNPPHSTVLVQLCRILKTISVNSPVFLPILALLELPLKFYLMTEVRFLILI